MNKEQKWNDNYRQPKQDGNLKEAAAVAAAIGPIDEGSCYEKKKNNQKWRRRDFLDSFSEKKNDC